MRDEPAHRLCRSNSPDTSVAAAHKVSTAKWKERVLMAICDSGDKGLTSTELVKKFPGVKYSTITARPKALLTDGFIYYKGDKREGARVMRATPQGFNEIHQRQKSFNDQISTSDALPGLPTQSDGGQW